MGCFLCCKKKKNIDLNAPLYRETIHPENDINENKNITLTVSEEKPPEKKIIEEEMVNEFKKEEHEESKIEITEKKQNYIIVENTKYSDKGLNLNENIGDDELLLKEDSPLICDYEKGVITFTHNGFINLFNYLWNLDNYKTTYDKEDLTIFLRYEGTPMNSNFYLIKMIYKIKKSDLKYNKDPDSIMDYCYDIKLRMLWDDALKLYERYEGNDNAFIICTWGKSPAFFISERETIEKRFRFSKDNAVYIMSTSIPLEMYEPKEDVVRFVDFLNLFKVSDEGDYIYFTSLNQVDFKMPIPQIIINMTLPNTSKSWYANIKKFANSIIYDRVNKTYERKEEEEDN
jgi:hypothetical protein